MRTVLYIVWQIVWGLPQTIAGLVVFIAHARCKHGMHHGAIVTTWNSRTGLSLGPFVFLGERDGAIDDRLLVHEYGHTIQSLILGPLYLFVIGIPSVIWLNVPALSRMRRSKGLSYYSFYPERWANYLGECVLKRKSMGQAHID